MAAPVSSAAKEILAIYDLQVAVEIDPLLRALYASDEEALRIAFRPEAEAYAYHGLGALQIAALLGRVELVKYLLLSGIAVDSRRDESWPTPLQLALMGGDPATVNLLLNNGANPRLTIGRGWPCVALAAMNGQVDALRRMLDTGVPVDEPSVGGQTPLMLASRHGYIEVMRLLLDAGAKPGRADQIGQTPLHHAVGSAQAAAARLLIERGADVTALSASDETPLMVAVREADRSTVRVLCEWPDSLQATNRAGLNAAWTAISGKRVSMLQILLEHRIEVESCDDQGRNLVHAAVSSKSPKMVELLGASGVDFNARDNSGCSPLTRAIIDGLEDVATALLANGADGNLQHVNGYTPLMQAAQYQRHGIARKLLAAGAEVNRAHTNGLTATLMASNRGDKEMLRLLLDAGADKAVCTPRGHGLLRYAYEADAFDVFCFLLERGVNPNATFRPTQWPIIMDLAWMGKLQFVQALLDHGADPNAADSDGQTALMVACRRGYEDIARLLLDRGADPARRDVGNITAWHIAVDRRQDDLANRMAALMTDKQREPTNRVVVYFDYDAPLATNVSVAGLFNEWNSTSHPMQRRPDDGWWYTELEVFPLEYEYKIVVDGQWLVDMNNPVVRMDQNRNTPNSIIRAYERAPQYRPTRVPSRADRLRTCVFNFQHDTAQHVAVAGEFNGWNTELLPMVRTSSNQWTASVVLSPGAYAYKFVVDGVWRLDPNQRATRVVQNSTNSLLVVLE